MSMSGKKSPISVVSDTLGRRAHDAFAACNASLQEEQEAADQAKETEQNQSKGRGSNKNEQRKNKNNIQRERSQGQTGTIGTSPRRPQSAPPSKRQYVTRSVELRKSAVKKKLVESPKRESKKLTREEASRLFDRLYQENVRHIRDTTGISLAQQEAHAEEVFEPRLNRRSLQMAEKMQREVSDEKTRIEILYEIGSKANTERRNKDFNEDRALVLEDEELQTSCTFTPKLAPYTERLYQQRYKTEPFDEPIHGAKAGFLARNESWMEQRDIHKKELVDAVNKTVKKECPFSPTIFTGRAGYSADDIAAVSTAESFDIHGRAQGTRSLERGLRGPAQLHSFQGKMRKKLSTEMEPKCSYSTVNSVERHLDKMKLAEKQKKQAHKQLYKCDGSGWVPGPSKEQTFHTLSMKMEGMSSDDDSVNGEMMH